jgi:hypothetical protein
MEAEVARAHYRPKWITTDGRLDNLACDRVDELLPRMGVG